MADSPEHPRRPGDAYFELAAVLPPGYLTTPPPAVGVRLTITARDGVPTRWDMDEHLAGRIVPALTQRRHVQVHAQAYDERARR